MKLITVGAGVLNQTPLAWRDNQRNIERAIEDARAQDVQLLCLPELCIPGYGCEDAFYAPGVQKTALDVLLDIAPQTAGMAVALGLPLLVRKAIFNTVALVVDGKIAGFVAKRHLAGDGLYYEPRWFRAWPAGKRLSVDIDGRETPVGDLHFTIDGVRVGFEICEDAWVARRPGSILAAKGIDIILNPSASHFAFGKHDVRERFVIEGSRAFGVSYVYANLVGNESGRAIYDGGALIASGGRMLAAGPRFGYRDAAVTSAVIDVDATRMLQTRTGSFMPDLDPSAAQEVEVPFAFRRRDQPPLAVEVPLGSVGFSKEEAFTRVIALALFDYLRKCRAQGFVVSLSGGADSSAVACLVAAAVHLACDDLGLEGVKEKLRHVKGLADAADADAVIRAMLLCVYQRTRNSSETTENAARGLASGLDAAYACLDVDSLVEGYVGLVGGSIDRALTWEQDDLALQNIQARVRSPGIWMLANLRGALLLSTSNRSEAAVGYATMDGDTSGGLAPIAGIDKDYLRAWLRWLETDGLSAFGPVAALAAVNEQQPTAELRPPGSGQTDEGDLMPYGVLEAVERAAIRDKQMPTEVFRAMRPRFPGIAPEVLGAWVERFFRLWCRNQWKRERYAPSFHVDDENLDPKTWCRFPILSGGFEREIVALRHAVAAIVADEAKDAETRELVDAAAVAAADQEVTS